MLDYIMLWAIEGSRMLELYEMLGIRKEKVGAGQPSDIWR